MVSFYRHVSTGAGTCVERVTVSIVAGPVVNSGACLYAVELPAAAVMSGPLTRRKGAATVYIIIIVCARGVRGTLTGDNDVVNNSVLERLSPSLRLCRSVSRCVSLSLPLSLSLTPVSYTHLTLPTKIGV